MATGYGPAGRLSMPAGTLAAMSGLTAVAMSGGVDSSVAAVELHRRGEHLVGVSHEVVQPLPSGVLEGFRRAGLT